MTNFFMPDGDGGHMSASDAEETYNNVRGAVEASSFWGGTLTDRRVYTVTSHHNGTDYKQTVGELTSDRLFVLAIFESLDETGHERFIVQSLRQTVHVDPSKVVNVTYFED